MFKFTQYMGQVRAMIDNVIYNANVVSLCIY